MKITAATLDTELQRYLKLKAQEAKVTGARSTLRESLIAYLERHGGSASRASAVAVVKYREYEVWDRDRLREIVRAGGLPTGIVDYRSGPVLDVTERKERKNGRRKVGAKRA